MKKLFLSFLAIAALFAIPRVEAQSAELWKYVSGILQPVVSTWNVTIKSNLNVQGTASGNHLYIGTLSGAGLTGCSDGTNSKLLWNSTTRTFSCGTDQNSGGGGNFGTGNVITLLKGNALLSSTGSLKSNFGSQFVQSSTGALANAFKNIFIASSTGDLLSVEKNIFLTSSTGAVKANFALQFLQSSTGSLKAFFDTLYFRSSTGSLSNSFKNIFLASSTGAIKANFSSQFVQSSTGDIINAFKNIFLASSTGSIKSNFSTQFVQSSTGDIIKAFQSIFLPSSTGSLRLDLFGFGQGLSKTAGGLVTVNSTLTGSLARFTTLSGDTIYAKNGLATSGALVVKSASMVENNLSVRGSVTGYTLNVSGLNSCTNLQTSVAGAVSCNNTTYLTAITAGQGLTIGGTNNVKLNTTISGSLVRFTTLSGNTIYSKNGISTSGALIAKSASMIENNMSVRGSMTGYTLNVSGLASCTNLQTSVAGSVSCNNTSYLTSVTAGQGLTLNGTNNFTLNTTISGSLARFTTLSGNTVYAKNGVSTSGALVVKSASMIENNMSVRGSMTGYTLNVSGLNSCTNLQTSVSGAMSCNNTTYLTSITAGQGLTISGTNNVKLNTTISGSLTRFTTLSGASVFAKTSLLASGTLVLHNVVKTSALMVLQGTGASYLEMSMQNLSAGSGSSTDFILGNNLYTTSNDRDYVNLGINSQKNTDTRYTLFGARDGYLWTKDGQLDIGTASGQSLRFFTNGTLSKNEKVRISTGAYLSLSGSLAIRRGSIPTSTKPGVALEVMGTISGASLTVSGGPSGNSITGVTTISGSTTIRQARICRFLNWTFCDANTACTTGSGNVGPRMIPPLMGNMTLSGSWVFASTSGSTNLTTVQVKNKTRGGYLFSPPMGLGSQRFSTGSYTAASTPYRFGSGDIIQPWISTISSVAPKGLSLMLSICP